MLELIVTCTEENELNDIKGSRIRFYIQDVKTPKSRKKLVAEWNIPIKTGRRSLAIHNSKYSDEFKKKIDKLCKEYSIDKNLVTGFHTKTEKVKAQYAKTVKNAPKTDKKEYQREFQQVRRIIKKASPEIQKLLKEPEGAA